MVAKIFLAGATGFVGGAVLAQILKHPKRSELDVTILVRNAEKAKTFETKFGVNKAVVGSNTDLEVIEGLAADADITFNVSDSDSVPLTEAILKGQKAKFEKTGKKPILIHTSGTAWITDNSRSEFASETIYDDTDIAQLKACPPEGFHHNVDLIIVAADTAGYVNTHIVTPATIWGPPEHELAKAGLTNTHSIQIPGMIKAALARGCAGVVGKGKAIWAASHVDDVASVYITVLNAVLANSEVAHGWEGFYYVGNVEFSWNQLAAKIGEATVALGLAKEAEPTEFTEEERGKFFWAEPFAWLAWGSNSRIKAARALALGWKPTHTVDDLFASIKPETESLSKA